MSRIRRPDGLADQVVWTGTPNDVDRAALFRRIGDALDRRRLTNDGPYVRELEEQLGERCGGHAVAVANGTLALVLSGQALGVRGRVAVPSWTFVGTAHAITALGAEPVFLDVGDDHVLDPEAVRRAISRRAIDALLPVHLFGRACDVQALGLMAADHELPLLYDAAQAFGTSALGRPVASYGTASILSLHATKWISAVEGGAIVTADAALAEECRLRRNFGFGQDGPVMVGTNAKLSELHAAFGLTMLERIDELVAANEERFRAYASVFDAVDGLRLFDAGPPGTTARPYVVVELDEHHAHLRDPLAEALRSAGVQCRRYFSPGVHRTVPYRETDLIEPLPRTERLARSCLSLPTGDVVTPELARVVAELTVELLAELGSPAPDEATPVAPGT